MNVRDLLCSIFIAISLQANCQKSRTMDWVNAPLNPMSAEVLKSIHSKGLFYGDVICEGYDFYDANQHELITRTLESKELALKYNGSIDIKDATGNIIESCGYIDGKEYVVKYRYNKKGLLVVRDNLADNVKSTFTYDAKNRIIKTEVIDEEGSFSIVYSYKKNGKELIINEKQLAASGELLKHLKYIYVKGLLMYEEEIGKKGSAYAYEYDHKGNWIHIFENGDFKNPKNTRLIIYKEQVKAPSSLTAFVEDRSYGPIVMVYLNGLETMLQTLEHKEDFYIYNPLEQEYYKATGAMNLLTTEHVGKEIPLESLGKNNNIVILPDFILLNGLQVY